MQGNSILEPVSGVTAEGYPQLSWVQQLPVTSKGMQDIRKAAIRGAIVVVLALAAFALAGPGGGWAGMAILVYGLIWVGLKAGPRGGLKWEDWARKPVTADCEAKAFIDKKGDALRFVWRFRMPNNEVVGDDVPLDSFTAFEIGDLSEWFTSPQDERNYAGGRGIMIHAEGLGPKCVAFHYGARAELAMLQERLTAAFINSRPALRRQLTQPAPQPEPAVAASSPEGDDDIPKVL